MIVDYTNQYGALNYKEWHPIVTDDLLKFLSILLVISIQHCQDMPGALWSGDPLTECPTIKRIMSKHRSLKILRYLHVYSL